MSKKEISLSHLTQKISNCRRCALRANCRQVVPGQGNGKTEILFIGEAPGQKEDEQGMPFVGTAGKLLTKMLANIHLTREDVFITNIVKCRPPKNRDPLPQEIEACTPWLVAQIKALQPKLIVTLGRHSMNFFMPELRIREAHGTTHQIQPAFLDREYLFLTLYHPAAGLYNGGLRKTLFSDFKKIPSVLEKAKKQNK